MKTDKLVEMEWKAISIMSIGLGLFSFLVLVVLGAPADSSFLASFLLANVLFFALVAINLMAFGLAKVLAYILRNRLP